jgi:hypothetical protein
MPFGAPGLLGADRGYAQGDFGEHPVLECSEGDLQAPTNSACWVAPSVSKARNLGSECVYFRNVDDDHEYGPRRTHLPGNSVNKGKRKGRSYYAPAPPCVACAPLS